MKRGVRTALSFSAMFLVMSLVVPGNAVAIPVCGTRDSIAETLATQYGEMPMHRGLTLKGAMVEVFSSQAGTFTVVVTLPTGMSCLATAGKQWQEIDTSSHSTKQNFKESTEREF